MTIETKIATQKQVQDLHEAEGVLTRTETVSVDGWLLYGRPVAEWPAEVVRYNEALNYLSGKLAEAEGLDVASPAGIERTIALQHEALEFAAK